MRAVCGLSQVGQAVYTTRAEEDWVQWDAEFVLESGSAPRSSLQPPARTSLRVARAGRVAKIVVKIPVGAHPPAYERDSPGIRWEHLPSDQGMMRRTWGCRATVTSSRCNDMIWLK